MDTISFLKVMGDIAPHQMVLHVFYFFSHIFKTFFYIFVLVTDDFLDLILQNANLVSNQFHFIIFSPQIEILSQD